MISFTSFRSKLCRLILPLLAGLASPAHAAPGDLDLSFDAGSGINGSVYTLARQPDGKIVIGGDFRMVKGLARSAFARLNSDGSGDPTFAGAGPNSDVAIVAAVVLQPDGKVLLGYDGGIARLNADGSPDGSFDRPRIRDLDLFEAGVNAIALQPDGKILIGGGFSIVNENLRSCVARLNADGTLDASFDPGGGVIGDFRWVSTIAQQPDGKIVIAGLFAGYHETFRPNLARINADGSIDETFDAHLPNEGSVDRIAIQPDGKVLFGGAFLTVDGTSRRSIARVNADGSLDISFNPGTGLDGGYIQAIALLPDGSVLIGGVFNTVNGTPRKGLAQLNADGSLDESFAPAGGDRREPVAFALEPDGRILVAGYDMLGTRSKHDVVTRLHADGSRDGSFNAGGGLEGFVGSIQVQPDGKLMVGGSFRYVDGVSAPGVARLHADGSRDESFNLDPEADGYFATVTLLSDGRILVGGYPNFPNGVNNTHGGIARVHADGSLDPSFDPGTGLDGGSLYTMAAQRDGKVVLAGSFDTVNGVERRNVARLNADGSVDATFDVNMDFTGAGINAVAVQLDGKILIGGPVVFPGNERRYAMVRVNPDGSRDASFNAAMVGTVGSIVIQADGKLIIGGSFSPEENDPFPLPIARLNANGSIDNSFHPLRAFSDSESSPGVMGAASIALQADGKVLVGGDYYLGHDAEGNDRYFQGIYRLNADGTLDSTFDPGPGPNSAVSAIALQADGKALVGGGFLFNDVVRPYLARVFTNDSAAPFPEITIEQPAGAALVDGTAVIDFGSIGDGDSAERVFTIRNTGEVQLTGVGVAIGGANASSFTVTAVPSEVVAAGGSTTFTVRFSPTARGIQSATLQIASNDADENPFDLGLNGSASNSAPAAAADNVATAYQASVDMDVVANDSDPDGDVLTLTGVSNPAHGTAQIVATADGQRIRYTPANGFSGTDSFTYAISDGFGGTATGTVTVTVPAKPRRKKTVSKGTAVTGAGEPSSGVPAGATWKTFAIPSIASDGTTAFGATITTGKGIVPVLYRGSSDEIAAAGAEHVVASKGDVAPGVNGATFGRFKDPLLNDDGTIVFVATLRGASKSASGGIWKHYRGHGNGGSLLVMQLGGEAAGVPGARWKAVNSVAVGDGAPGEETIAFTATMAPGPGGVRASSDAGLWLVNANGTALALREGSTLVIGATAKKVKNFVALQALPGAAGQGRGVASAGVLARVRFDDGSHAIVRLGLEEHGISLSAVALAGEAATGLNATLTTFGAPTQSRAGHACFIATLSPAAQESDTAIFRSDGSGLELVAREDDQAGTADAATFSTFHGQAIDADGRVAFSAAMRGGTTEATNNTAIFLQVGNLREVVAREGDHPPGVPPGAKWAGFPSLALADGAAGPIFIGKLVTPAPGRPNPARVTRANDTGVWATDLSGNVQLIVRTGDMFDASRRITALTLLATVPCSSAQSRSFSNTGELIYRVTLNDGSQHIASVPVP